MQLKINSSEVAYLTALDSLLMLFAVQKQPALSEKFMHWHNTNIHSYYTIKLHITDDRAAK